MMESKKTPLTITGKLGRIKVVVTLLHLQSLLTLVIEIAFSRLQKSILVTKLVSLQIHNKSILLDQYRMHCLG